MRDTWLSYVIHNYFKIRLGVKLITLSNDDYVL